VSLKIPPGALIAQLQRSLYYLQAEVNLTEVRGIVCEWQVAAMRCYVGAEVHGWGPSSCVCVGWYG
jgi:hypothetical protein